VGKRLANHRNGPWSGAPGESWSINTTVWVPPA
jgi:hypothetical protein